MRPTIAITTGDPAGIGPEISLRAAWEVRHHLMPVLIGDARWLGEVSAKVNPAIRLQTVAQGSLPDMRDKQDVIAVVDCPLAHTAISGQLDSRNSLSVLRTLDIAIAGAQQGWFDAIVTAPLQKSTINDAGIAFTGHTEYLAEKTGTPQVVMMLAGSVTSEGASFPLRVALATTHLPLKDVSDAITIESLKKTLEIIDRDLKRWFGIVAPRILVCGLNPHAGEGGYLGREEIEVIGPVIDVLRKKGMNVLGPYPADTLFQPALLQQADCVLAMYHDQGLPVLKHASFGSAVNVTLGLPIIRTSVDHGTALDQAKKGVGHAHHRSMIEAILLAAQMAAHSKWQRTNREAIIKK